MKNLILCLGNEVITDDGFGEFVAAELNRLPQITENADVIFAPVAGFALIDLMRNRHKVLIVDAIETENGKPGELHFFPAGLLTPGRHLTTSHQISLPTAMALGSLLGEEMPVEIDVLAVEAEDLVTLGIGLTRSVSLAVAPAIEKIKEWVLRAKEGGTVKFSSL